MAARSYPILISPAAVDVRGIRGRANTYMPAAA
jgi:hypothetical protein